MRRFNIEYSSSLTAFIQLNKLNRMILKQLERVDNVKT
ncbi:hypothetical protein P20652_2534 [Pseudoalteromonas sp. BSi20652]|nr:hypothetical protein P20652_2534 [Pseudoalteromonas sp. BSi20652]